jgi:hypothetical protein
LGARGDRRIVEPSQAEIKDFDLSRVAEHQIGGLDVPMHQLSLVNMLKSQGGTSEEFTRGIDGELRSNSQ